MSALLPKADMCAATTDVGYGPERLTCERVDPDRECKIGKIRTMKLEAGIRTQIAVLIYSMTNAVMFGAGLSFVLMVPALNADAGFWISAVVVASLILAAPFAWVVAPRLRARYWRQKLLAMPSRLASAPTRDH